MNEVDKLRAHHQAKEHAENLYDQHYGSRDQYDPQYDRPQQLGYQRGGGNDGGDSGYGRGGGDSGY